MSDEPVRKTMCATCPFQPGSLYGYLANDLAMRAISDASRICHSTGKNNAIHKRTGLKPHICRGTRDIQLKVMAAMGAIDAATDEAWNKRRVEIGMNPVVVKDPVKGDRMKWEARLAWTPRNPTLARERKVVHKVEADCPLEAVFAAFRKAYKREHQFAEHELEELTEQLGEPDDIIVDPTYFAEVVVGDAGMYTFMVWSDEYNAAIEEMGEEGDENDEDN